VTYRDVVLKKLRRKHKHYRHQGGDPALIEKLRMCISKLEKFSSLAPRERVHEVLHHHGLTHFGGEHEL
jgi:hypothetical protein